MGWDLDGLRPAAGEAVAIVVAAAESACSGMEKSMRLEGLDLVRAWLIPLPWGGGVADWLRLVELAPPRGELRA